jgi:hypothetical protein
VPGNHVGTGNGLNNVIVNDSGDGVGDGLRPSPTGNTNAIHRSWLDEFGTLIATLEGRSGGRSIMVIAKLEDAENTLTILLALPSFKGRIILAILEQLHTAPLEMVMNANNPNIVIALEPNCTGIATRGAAMTTQSDQITSSTGITYLETGNYEAWTAGHLEPALTTDLEYSSIPASVATNLKIPCATCDLEHLPYLLETLLVQNS